MAQTTSQKNIMTIAMGAMLLVTLATTVIVAAHYWEMLSGVFLLAILGLALPDWTGWWASYLHAKAIQDGQEDSAVEKTSLIVSGGISLLMILNAGAILAVWWDDQQKAASIAQVSTAETDRIKATSAGATDAIEARGRVVAQLKSQGMSDRAIREYLRTEAKRDEATALTQKKTEAVTSAAYVSKVPEPIKKYMAFWVFIVPFLGGLVGVFALIISVRRPGGIEFGSQNGNQFPHEIDVKK